jgi:hypothetical protein
MIADRASRELPLMGPIGVESGHLQPPLPRRKECGNHTHYFSNSPRVTVRVNDGATWGYVRTRDHRPIDVLSQRFPTGSEAARSEFELTGVHRTSPENFIRKITGFPKDY